ncbi:MAG: cobalamin-binding protein [Gammaproteobacteria bacterium]|nr:cobalamin-binding protein [Gammaproteobacteria bacterium]
MLIGLASTAALAGIHETDDRGREVALPRPAQRIVSLAPMVTELLFAAGAGDAVVGVTAFSDFPVQARRLPQVGNSVSLDYERIVALRPDLVVAWGSGTNRAAVERLEGLGIPVFTLEPRRLADIETSLARLARLAATPAAARAAALEFRREIEALRAQFRGRAPVSVFLQISDRPLMTLSDTHMVGELLSLCGGRNVFGTLGMLAPQVGIEDVLRADPQVILVSDSLGADAIEGWRGRRGLRAVERGQLYAIAADITLRQTPRIVQGARRICELLEQARGV